MPFWWRRRKKNWWGTRFRRRRQFRYKKRRPRRVPRRRRFRKTTYRRRRRRRHKVRRKKPKIFIQQWQPDSIVKCKIRSFDYLIVGAQGNQYKCYTNEQLTYPPPKSPSGGGFGCQVITLSYLYNLYKQHRSIWTRSNEFKDLVRYTGCRLTFYRHPTTDYIISYIRQPPFNIDKYTYTQIHPVNMLLRKRKRILYSLKTKPWGQSKVTLKIGPPKQMVTKWFFQQQFATAGLVQIQACAADFNYSIIGNTWASTTSTLYCLNTGFYQLSDWGKVIGTHTYHPYATMPSGLYFWYKVKPTTTNPKGEDKVRKTPQNYYESINYDKGYFDTRVLNAFKVTTDEEGAKTTATIPVVAARYNPQADTGQGNELWCISTFSPHYDKPTIDLDLIYTGQPIWMMLYGYYSFILYVKKDPTFLDTHMLILRSPAIKLLSTTSTQDYFPFFDKSFLEGKMPFEEYLSDNEKKLWYPSVKKQIQTINTLVTSGPLVPKFEDDRDSTWELKYKSTFFTKWGGPQITDKPVVDPKKQPEYDVPDKLQGTVQISDPLKQTCETIFHDWDYRRGMLTSTAIKRMRENLQTDSSIKSVSTETPTKRRKITAEIPHIPQETEKIKACLQELFEEDSYQEEEDLHKLIKQQQQKQRHLKHNLLKLISNLKQQQKMMQLQTGIIS
nr:MAG: ORF1 [Torque teno midi virus]